MPSESQELAVISYQGEVMIRTMLKMLAVFLALSFSNAVMTTSALAAKPQGCKEGTTKIPGDGRRCKCSGGQWSCEKIR